MFVLGIETSAAICSISWLRDGQILLEYVLEQPNVHTQILDDLIGSGFRRIGKKPADIDLISIASGPGSFTGLRIGMAYAKGLAYVLEKPIVAVTNFEVLAQHAIIGKYPVYSIIDARRNNYFLGIFNEDVYHADHMEFCNHTELIKRIKKAGIIVTPIKDFEKKVVTKASYILARYTASTVAGIGEYKYKNGLISENIEDMEPLYLRKFAGAG